MPLAPQRVTREFHRSTEFTGIPATSPNIPARATATPIKNIPREVTDTRCVEISALTDPSLLGSCAHAKFRFKRRASTLGFLRISKDRISFSRGGLIVCIRRFFVRNIPRCPTRCGRHSLGLIHKRMRVIEETNNPVTVFEIL